jgi:hypothetical protein
LNPKQSQVILIHRSRAQIPQPELYIGSDATSVMTRVNNLDFVLTENLTAVDQSKRVCHRSRAQISQPELYIGSDATSVMTRVNNLDFVLNENLTAVDHSKRVCR